MSRNHAKITFFNGEFYLEDFGSKFGTLVLIQNDILFLPNKDVSIQTGKNHFLFKLKRTCLGLLKCYNNKLFYNKKYLNQFLNSDKKVYEQILETFNNNIIDPIEKYSSVSGSCTPSKAPSKGKSNETIEENKILETISDMKNIDDEEKSSEIKNDMNANINLNLSNGIRKNEILIESNNIKEDNKDNNINYLDSIPILNLNKNILTKQNEYKKQNESHELLFNEMNNNNDINNNNEENNNKKFFSKIKILNILNNNYINKRSSSVINKGKTLSNSLIKINKNNINNDLANTQRENKKVLENKEDKK